MKVVNVTLEIASLSVVSGVKNDSSAFTKIWKIDSVNPRANSACETMEAKEDNVH